MPLDHIYVTQGRYYNDIEKGTWKHFHNGRLVRKESYKKNICKTKYYYANGKLTKKGSAKLEITTMKFIGFILKNGGIIKKMENLTV